MPARGTLVDVFFLADGSYVARLALQGPHRLVHVAANGTVLSEQQEPTELEDMTLMMATG